MKDFKYYNCENEILSKQTDKLADFREKIKLFEEIKTVASAKELAEKLFHINTDVTHMNFDNAHGLIVQSSNLFRICLESETEFICYNIGKKEEETKVNA